MQGYSRETGLMEPQPEKPWVAHAREPWEGVQIVEHAADASSKEKLQEWMLLV